MTTNLERWQHLTKDLGAPPQFLHFAYLAGVSMALERRVFYGDLHRPLFVNNFTILVGPAGVGKGQSMREIKRIIGALPRIGPDKQPVRNPKTGENVPLFNPLSDTMTFEYLVQALAKEKRHITRPDGNIYEYSPGYLCLEELSSLLRINKADDVARLLLNLYDSSEPFRYSTKKAGDYEIRDGCLNLIAGTTVDFLQKAEQSGMLGEGLFSRMIIVYADRRPFDRFEQNILEESQLTAQKELRAHFFRLGHLFGPVTYSRDTLGWLEQWWSKEQVHITSYGDEKLANFFSRRKVQVMKLAAAIHFSETCNSFEIQTQSFETAARLIRELEEPIVRLARKTGRNVQYSTIERFVGHLALKKVMTHGEVLQFLSADLQMRDIIDALEMLEQSKRIIRNQDTYTIPPNS